MWDARVELKVTIGILDRMNFCRIPCLFGFLMMFCLLASSQSVEFRQLTKEEGLASDVVYYTMQDSKGYLWICTQAMISRFDGKEFVHYDESRGLQLRSIFCATEDEVGRIWFASYGRELFYIEGDTILPYAFNDSLSKYVDVAAAFHSLEIDDNNTLTLGTPYDGMICIDSAGHVSNEFTATRTSPVRLDLWSSDGNLLSATQFAAGAGREDDTPADPNEEDRSKILDIRWKDDLGETRRHSYNLGPAWKHQRQFYHCWYGDDVVLSYDRLLIRGVQGENPDTLLIDDLIISLEEVGDKLLVGTYSSGILCFDRNLSSCDHPYKFLDGKAVGDMLVDKEGGLWFSILGEGLFYVPNNQIAQRYKEDIIWELSAGLNEVQILAGSKAGNVYEKSGDGWAVTPTSVGPVTFVTSLSDGKIIRGRKRLIQDGHDDLELEKWHSILSDVVEWNGTVYGLSSHGVIDIAADTLFEFPTDIKTGRFADFAVKDGLIYLARTRELFTFNGAEFQQIEVPEPHGSSGYQCMTLRDSTLVIGTTKRGLWVMKMHGDELTFDEQVPTAIVEQVRFLDDSTLGVATTDGFELHRQRAGKWIRVNKLSRDQGLSSSMVYDFQVYDDTLWIATAKGLNFLATTTLEQPKVAPVTRIDRVMLNGTEQLRSGAQLTYDQNNISIKYTGIAYREGDGISFKYRLNQDDAQWLETNDRAVNFNSLPPGEYVFEVLSMNELGNWQDEPAVFEFSVLPLFWQTTTFFVFCVLVFLLLIGLVYRLNINRIKARLEKEQQFVFYQQRSVAMQMNPHFLYNSLNSIVKFISTNERGQAVRYLSRFAKLMRHFLNNSKNDFVSLEEELTALELYCSLEKVRFKDRFDYEFSVDLKDDREDLYIPTLLLQPAIENAIRHGIAHLNRHGNLKVTIEQQSNILKAIVEDNGVGRKASAGYRKKLGDDGSLHSTEITRERISLLSKSQGQNLKYEIEDILEGEEVRGTRVIFELPLLKQ